MFQRLAAARADRYAADVQAIRRVAPQPDHHAAHAIGRTTEVAQQHGQQLHLGRADLYTSSVEATKREIYAVRATLLPALIKALRSKAPSLERQMAIAN